MNKNKKKKLPHKYFGGDELNGKGVEGREFFLSCHW